jgi:hypothetical protein
VLTFVNILIGREEDGKRRVTWGLVLFLQLDGRFVGAYSWVNSTNMHSEPPF